MTNAPISIDQVLQVENDAELMDIVEPVTGVPAWLLVRNYFFRVVIEGMLYATEGLRRHAPDYRIADMARAAGVSLAHNLTVRPGLAPVVILGSGAGAMLQGGRRIDRLTTYFADALSQAAWSELGVHLFNVKFAVRAPRVTLTAHRRLVDHALARASMSDAHLLLASRVVGIAARSTHRHLGWVIDSELLTGLERRLAIEMAGARRVISRVRHLHRVHRPRLVLADQSCYGTKALLNAVLRDHDIDVVEYQHGVITRAHEAYNFGDSWRDSTHLRRVLPSAILLYGDWWGTQINLPIRKLVIGNPHRETAMHGWPQLERDGGTILVLGDGIDTAFYEEFCAGVARALPGQHIVFRPHPLEREQACLRHQRQSPKYEIDVSPDIYVSFARAAWVAAEVSTGLFEVAGTRAQPVVIDSKKSRFNFPDDPFPRVDGPEAMAALVKGGHPRFGQVKNELWAVGWRDRFDTWTGEAMRASGPP